MIRASCVYCERAIETLLTRRWSTLPKNKRLKWETDESNTYGYGSSCFKARKIDQDSLKSLNGNLVQLFWFNNTDDSELRVLLFRYLRWKHYKQSTIIWRQGLLVTRHSRQQYSTDLTEQPIFSVHTVSPFSLRCLK